jgi:hypothetical protein
MSERPKEVSADVESVEKLIHDLDHVSKESVISISTVESKIGGHDKKVGIWRCKCHWKKENAISLKTKMR